MYKSTGGLTYQNEWESQLQPLMIAHRSKEAGGTLVLTLLSLSMICPVQAQVLSVLNYQGRVVSAGSPFTGTGLFKFALISGDATQTYWMNAVDTTPSDGVPDTALGVTVKSGLYTIQLGEAPAMLPLDAMALAHPDVRLRVWFNDGIYGFQRLLPDTKLGSVPYSIVARTLLGGVAVLGDLTSGSPKPGTIRWNGSAFQGFNGARWELLASDPNAVRPVSGMTWIMPGSFALGATAVGDAPFVTPVMSVTISRGFWMGSREVTQCEYQSLMGSNPSLFTGDLARPVEQVSWNDATQYCALLTTQERMSGRIPANWAYQLPTDAQWEYAARAGTATRFSYGDDPGYEHLTDYAWYSINSDMMTHPVGLKAPNPWGLFDMHGNVWEWCKDYFDWNYPGGTAIDPQGPAIEASTDAYRVIRGGGCGFYNKYRTACQSVGRLSWGQNYGLGDIGFRVVLAEVP